MPLARPAILIVQTTLLHTKKIASPVDMSPPVTLTTAASALIVALGSVKYDVTRQMDNGSMS